MRYAIKVAYDGSRFHGSQRQGLGDKGSVEGAVNGALIKFGEIDGEEESTVRFSSRTDSGVSALANVFSVESDTNAEELLKALNANLEGICCWAAGEMRANQNVRWANSRWYRYHMPPWRYENDFLTSMNSVLLSFIGTHDFRFFGRIDADKNTEIQIERSQVYDISGSGEMVIVDIVGTRFLWNQVRRMVGAAYKVASGGMDGGKVKKLLETDGSEDELKGLASRVPTMPPTGLVLMDVGFKDIDFTPHSEAAGLSARRWSEEAWASSIRVLLHTAMRGVMGNVIWENPEE
jgi:tRNA pseudouridine38-40 synthase